MTYDNACKYLAEQGEVTLLLRQLTKRFGTVEPQLQARIQGLSIKQLEALGEVLLDFSIAADLVAWLDEAVQ